MPNTDPAATRHRELGELIANGLRLADELKLVDVAVRLEQARLSLSQSDAGVAQSSEMRS